jgi:hypothetical protein
MQGTAAAHPLLNCAYNKGKYLQASQKRDRVNRKIRGCLTMGNGHILVNTEHNRKQREKATTALYITLYYAILCTHHTQEYKVKSCS